MAWFLKKLITEYVFRKSTYLLGSSSIFLFLGLLLVLKIINISHVYAVNGQTIFISEPRYENKGHFVYLLDFKKE